eukprot:GHVT01061891.1.p1 GENE.GHVT01061891.1~~GHVT01061891.1.p1  ORF type:complete len:126 (-),score=2.27 GHVT01061891.1:940-1317(-)
MGGEDHWRSSMGFSFPFELTNFICLLKASSFRGMATSSFKCGPAQSRGRSLALLKKMRLVLLSLPLRCSDILKNSVLSCLMVLWPYFSRSQNLLSAVGCGVFAFLQVVFNAVARHGLETISYYWS